MKIRKSGAAFSSIVSIGQKIKSLRETTGEDWLELNRGVNDVVNIDLSNIITKIDQNSKDFQVYAANSGMHSLKSAILADYFQKKKHHDNISITPGGMSSLDLVLQILDVDTFHFPAFYWGSYSKMADIRKRDYRFYKNISDFDELTDRDCVFICDPSNPTGIVEDSNLLYGVIKDITSRGATVVFDSPYRKLFYPTDDIFERISNLEGVIITESFSKTIGLSGLRIGFIWSNSEEFNKELSIRLLYSYNGVSAPSQMIISELISSPDGKLAIADFRAKTVSNITTNISYLGGAGLLSTELYGDRVPIGIFSIVNKTEDYLFSKRIGSVSLDKFTQIDKERWSAHSRICVSVEHRRFVDFFKLV